MRSEQLGLHQYKNKILVRDTTISDAFPCYNGLSRDTTISDWQKHLELLFQSHQVPECYRLLIAELKLRGPAFRLWGSRRNDSVQDPP